MSDYIEWELGESYHIETYTKYWTGVLVGETETHIYIKNACCIASTGYYKDYLSGSNPFEAEPCPPDTIIRIRKDSIPI